MSISRYELDGLHVDHLIVGGGPAGLALAAEFCDGEATHSDAHVLALTAEDQFGGTALRSMEQFRTDPDPVLRYLIGVSVRASMQLAEETGQPLMLPHSPPYVFVARPEGSAGGEAFTMPWLRANFGHRERGWPGDDPEFFDANQPGEVDKLLERYPFLAADIAGAAILHQTGRLPINEYATTLQSYLGRQGAKFAAGVEATRIVLGRGDRVTKVETTAGTIHTRHVILALGAHILQLSKLFLDSDGRRLPIHEALVAVESQFEVTERQSFVAPLPFEVNQEYGHAFVISPNDGEYIRLEPAAPGARPYGTFGYAGPGDPLISMPLHTPPTPNQASDARRECYFPAAVYGGLSEVIPAFQNGGVDPRGSRSGGYYVRWLGDRRPVAGRLSGFAGLGHLRGIDVVLGLDGHGNMLRAGVARALGAIDRNDFSVPLGVIRALQPGRAPYRGEGVTL